MELLLIRHSMTPGNLKKQYVGSTDQPLSPEGEALARERRENMPSVDGLWVSPLQRCRQTAELLFPGMEQHIVQDLRECDFGDYECKTWEELKDEELYRAWIGGDLTVTFPHGESMEGFIQRCRRGIQEVAKEARDLGLERAAVVAHGGTWMVVMGTFGRPERKLYDWQVKNCRGFRVSVQEDPFILTLLEEF